MSPSRTPSPITIMTDFGLSDAYVGVMKGVILEILPWAQIVDLSHQIEPQNIVHAAYVLQSATAYFPSQTVHLVVVDPGVGTSRRPIAVFTSRACYVGPDNGVFSLVYAQESVRDVRQLSNPAYNLSTVSHTFHGRDIFAPFAAYIASGVPAHSLGPVVPDPVRLDFPQPASSSSGEVRGQIVYADHFGNLVSNIPASLLSGTPASNWTFIIARTELTGLQQTYGRVNTGTLCALVGSTGLVEVAERDGSAANRLSVGAGAPLIARPQP